MKQLLSTFLLLTAVLLSAAERYHRPGKASAGVAIFPEIQMEYGLHNNFYLHGHWNDRPLFADRSIRPSGEKRQLQVKESVIREAELLKFYGCSGFAPLGEPDQIKFMLDAYAGAGMKDTLILASVYPPIRDKGYRESKDFFYRTVALHQHPNLYRINGKMVISSYNAGRVSPENWKKILAEARKKYGDVFQFVAAVNPPADAYSSQFQDRWHGNPPAEEVQKFEAMLQSYLDVCDGIMLGLRRNWIDPDGVYGELEIPGLREHLTAVIRRVMERPQNRGKLLGICIEQGYINRQSGLTRYENATQMLRSYLEFAEALDPDFIQAFEWNEWNENTCFMPTVRKGNSAGRILRYEHAVLNGTKITPADGDDLSIPNWILSFRVSLKLGEKLSFELLNVPDGSDSGATSGIFGRVLGIFNTADSGTVSGVLRLLTPDGKKIHEFAAVSLKNDSLKAETLELPTEKFAEYPVLIPELEIRYADGKNRIFRNFPAIRLYPAHNVDYMYVRLPLRECAEVQTELTAGKEENGVRRIQGKVISAVPLNSVELLCNGNVMRYIEQNPEFDQNRETVIRVRAESRGWKHLKGNLRILNASAVKARSAQIDGYTHYVMNYRKLADGLFTDIWVGGHGLRSFLFAIPNTETEKAVFSAELDGVSFTVPAADIVKYGVVGREAGGIFWRLERADLAPDIGFPLKTREISFDCNVKTADKVPVFQLRVVDMNGHRSWSAPVAAGEYTGPQVKIPVWSETLKKRIRPEVAQDRIPDARYVFDPKRGTVLSCSLSAEFTGDLGGGYHYCQPNQSVSYSRPQDFVSAAPAWSSSDGVSILKFNGKYDNLTFHPTVFPLGAFTVEFEIKPDNADDMILLQHNNGQQVSGLNAFIVGGKLMLGYVGKRGDYTPMPTELPVIPGQWNRIRIVYDLRQFKASVNGQQWKTPATGRGVALAGLSFGGTSAKAFLPNPRPGFFKGELKSLRFYQNAEKL